MSANLLKLIYQELSNSDSSDEITMYCVIRSSSSFNHVDKVVAVYFDEELAVKHESKLIDSLPERSKHKVYIQTTVLGKEQ